MTVSFRPLLLGTAFFGITATSASADWIDPATDMPIRVLAIQELERDIAELETQIDRFENEASAIEAFLESSLSEKANRSSLVAMSVRYEALIGEYQGSVKHGMMTGDMDMKPVYQAIEEEFLEKLEDAVVRSETDISASELRSILKLKDPAKKLEELDAKIDSNLLKVREKQLSIGQIGVRRGNRIAPAPIFANADSMGFDGFTDL